MSGTAAVVYGLLGTAAAGAGIGAATGGILGALIAMGVPHEDARYFERGIREGGTLVAVSAGMRAAEAREALVAHGGSPGGLRHRARPAFRSMAVPPASPPVREPEPAGPGTASWTGPERRARFPGRRRSDN